MSAGMSSRAGMQATDNPSATPIFLDVFRRADKNDDGALHWEEFRNFFADGILSEEELKKLFYEIDTHKTNNIDTAELCSYFSKHLGNFGHVFPAIESLNDAISKALGSCHSDYSKKSHTEQFCVRFLLREVVNHISAIEQPLECAGEALEKETHATRDVLKPALADVEAKGVPGAQGSAPDLIIPGRYARRARQQFATQTSFGDGSPTALNKQIERLQSLVDKLENKVVFDPVEEEVVAGTEPMSLLVHRRFVCSPSADKGFRNSLRTYVEGTSRDDNCSNVNVRSQAGSNLYNIYEIWTSENQWKSHQKTDVSKTFLRANIDNLELPEQLKTMVIPGKWCKK